MGYVGMAVEKSHRYSEVSAGHPYRDGGKVPGVP